jgi:hypothetical protein
MKFILPQSLFRGACSQKTLKNLKKFQDQVMLPKSHLFPIGIDGPLEVKELKRMEIPFLDLRSQTYITNTHWIFKIKKFMLQMF